MEQLEIVKWAKLNPTARIEVGIEPMPGHSELASYFLILRSVDNDTRICVDLNEIPYAGCK